MLSLAVTGVLAGCWSLTAIWEDTTDLTGADLRSLACRWGRPCPRSRLSAGSCRIWIPQVSTPS
ncbi:hypothetical protein [Actinomyces viscosus]|uniref:hypothetical protein n=1 Tax=Actinomyces viscosus TaxID=1656 RepID=UPI001E3EA63B|nr:hypothetical protein [Actinomyces viscosus]